MSKTSKVRPHTTTTPVPRCLIRCIMAAIVGAGGDEVTNHVTSAHYSYYEEWILKCFCSPKSNLGTLQLSRSRDGLPAWMKVGSLPVTWEIFNSKELWSLELQRKIFKVPLTNPDLPIITLVHIQYTPIQSFVSSSKIMWKVIASCPVK